MYFYLTTRLSVKKKLIEISSSYEFLGIECIKYQVRRNIQNFRIEKGKYFPLRSDTTINTFVPIVIYLKY